MAGPLWPTTCPLFSKGTGFALTDGIGHNGVMLVGEALGQWEAKRSKPFQGEAGMMLNSLLNRSGLDRRDFLIGNVVNCQPPGNWLDGAPWELSAIEHCRRFLDETLAAYPHIKVLVPMGNIPMRALLSEDFGGMKFAHGTVHRHISYEKWVVPTFHPSYINRGNHKEIPTVLCDIQKAIETAKDGYTHAKADHIELPSGKDAEFYRQRYFKSLAEQPDLFLASDIETSFSMTVDEDEAEDDPSVEVTRISFCFEDGVAITMPWTHPYIETAKKLLASPGDKGFWNGDHFDKPRLAAAGAPVSDPCWDVQDAWHFLYSDLPKKLGYVAPFFVKRPPWKHEARTRQEFYSCEDSANLWRIAVKLKAKLLEC